MIALRASLLAAGMLGLVVASPLFAQAVNFDDKPTGFLTVQTGGVSDAKNSTPRVRVARSSVPRGNRVAP